MKTSSDRPVSCDNSNSTGQSNWTFCSRTRLVVGYQSTAAITRIISGAEYSAPHITIISTYFIIFFSLPLADGDPAHAYLSVSVGGVNLSTRIPSDAGPDSLLIDCQSFSSLICDFSRPTRRSPLRRPHPRVEQQSRRWGKGDPEYFVDSEHQTMLFSRSTVHSNPKAPCPLGDWRSLFLGPHEPLQSSEMVLSTEGPPFLLQVASHQRHVRLTML